MNLEIKQRWINALRSGHYEQATGKLKNVSGYCCLGVLCDLYLQEKQLGWDELQTNAYLPRQIREWAELENYDPEVILDNGQTTTLSTLNDNGSSFSEIAYKIETSLYDHPIDPRTSFHL